MLGNIAKGILVPTFGTHMTAQLEAWQVTTPMDWQLSGLGGIPRPRYFDLDPDTVDLLPVVGGCAFDLERLRWAIPGARLRPPNMDPHVFHRDNRENPDQAAPSHDRNVTIDPRATDDCHYRKESKKNYSAIYRGGPRDESVLAHARRASAKRRQQSMSKEPKKEEKVEDPPKRGRSPGRTLTFTDIGKRTLAEADARRKERTNGTNGP